MTKIQNSKQLAFDFFGDSDIAIWNLFVIWCLCIVIFRSSGFNAYGSAAGPEFFTCSYIRFTPDDTPPAAAPCAETPAPSHDISTQLSDTVYGNGSRWVD